MNPSRLPLHSSGLWALVFSLVGCGEETLRDDQKSTIPVKRVLIDNQNREIKVTIIGRESSHITFVRLSDDSRHRFPVSSLSGESRAFVEALPMVAPPPQAQESSNSKSQKEFGSLKFLRIRLKDLDERIAKNTALREIPETGLVAKRSLASEYKRMMTERIKLVSEISDLESK